MKKLLNYNLLFLLLSIIIIFLGIIHFNRTRLIPQINEVTVIDSTEKQQIHLQYGFPINEFEVESHHIKRNQNLSKLLNTYNVSFSTIDKIARKAKKVFNVRRIKSGHEFSVLFSKDSLRSPEYFIYENTPVEYIVFDLQDTLNVYKGHKEIKYVQKQINGTINSSLWNALKELNADPLLSLELSEIYAWTIDFFGIGKGDSFQIIYQEALINDKPIHDIKVLAANFIYHNTNNYAIAFSQGDKEGYFDEEGNSLQKAFLKAPLRFSRISSRFSNNRYHPVLKRYRAHHGIDYAAPTGTPVHSIGDGLIIKKGYQKNGGGRYLKIKHNSVYTTTYMHFSRFVKGMRSGIRIKQGQTIGYVGASGLATGPHLDFRVYKNGTPINPLKLKSPPIAPVKQENLQRFNTIKDSVLNLLTLKIQSQPITIAQ